MFTRVSQMSAFTAQNFATGDIHNGDVTDILTALVINELTSVNIPVYLTCAGQRRERWLKYKRNGQSASALDCPESQDWQR